MQQLLDAALRSRANGEKQGDGWLPAPAAPPPKKRVEEEYTLVPAEKPAAKASA